MTLSSIRSNRFLTRAGHALRDPRIVSRFLNRQRKLLYCRFRQRHNDGIFSINIHSKIGFFGNLTWSLFILNYCAEQNLIPHIVLTSENYVSPERGPDWFRYFFEQYEDAYVQQHPVTTVRIEQLQDLGLRMRSPMTLERAAHLAGTYLTVRPQIVSIVDAFARAHFADTEVVGVHYRGTDKFKEAPRVPYEVVRTVVETYLRQHPGVGCVFIATDESDFLEYARKALAPISVCACDDLRSDTAEPVHRRRLPGDDGYRKGREALVNALLLSRCGGLLRTSSTLSAWASIFNPTLPVTMLNEPYREALWFPEREIIRRASQNSTRSPSKMP